MDALRRYLHLWGQRWKSLFRSVRVERELDRELQFHIEQAVAARVDAGDTPSAARAAVMREFGSVASIEEGCRDTRRVAFVQNIVRDARVGARALRRQPMLVVAATTSIALGVAANLAIFGLANAFLLSTPTARDAENLVHIRTTNGSHVSYGGWRALDESRALAGVAGYNIEVNVTWSSASESTTVMPLVVTANFFDVVGVPVAIGRGFTATEARAGLDPRVVVISDGFWRRRLDADPQVIGRGLTINGHPYTILGVLPAGIRSLPGYGVVPDFYLPIGRTLDQKFDASRHAAVQLIGRLAPGQSVDAGRSAIAAAAAAYADGASDPEFRTIKTFVRVGGVDQAKEFAEVGAFFIVLMIIASLVLAIACANVGGLLIARGALRRREVALRVALGASRGRIVQQLLVEGLLLSVGGTLGGLLVATLAGRLLTQIPLPLPVTLDLSVAIDARMVTLALALVIVCTVLSGLAPALQATRKGQVPALKNDEVPYGHRRLTLRRLLVMGQVAASVVLLVVALLFVRNLTRAGSVDPGFDVDRTVLAKVTFVEGRQGPRADPAIEPIVDRVRALPGVEGAAFAQGAPLTVFSGSHTGTDLPLIAGEPNVRVEYASNLVGPGYFQTMGIAVRGREFAPTDRRGSPPVVIVSETFAARYLSGRAVIGSPIAIPGPKGPTPVTVVGIAADSKYRSLGEAGEAAIYEPYMQRDGSERFLHVIIRTQGPPADALNPVRALFRQTDPSIAVEIEPFASALTFAFLPSRVGAAVLGTLGALGTMLAMIGLYGLVSFAVGRRTREIGIRLALGAPRSRILQLVTTESAVLVLVGAVAGLAVAAVVTRPLALFLVPGQPTTDPLSLAGTVAILTGVSLIATWWPVRSALRVDPSITLRQE